MLSIFATVSIGVLLVSSSLPAQARRHDHKHVHWSHFPYPASSNFAPSGHVTAPSEYATASSGYVTTGNASSASGFVSVSVSDSSAPASSSYYSVASSYSIFVSTPTASPSSFLISTPTTVLSMPASALSVLSASSPEISTSASALYTSSSTPLSIPATASSSPVAGTASIYSLKSTWDATNFFDKFKFFTDADPTNGFVQYVDEATAKSAGMAKYEDGRVYLGADVTTTLDPNGGAGRKSTRLESKTAFNNGLLIGDFEHMPGGACGIWPAFWVINNDPSGPYTEIDIVEGVALQDHGDISMYVGPECTMAVRNPAELGTSPNFNCALSDGGCHIAAPTGTFGDSFNDHNGGVWALQVEADGIRIWQFPRANIPTDITAGDPDPENWSAAIMDWKPDSCNIETAFQSMTTVFNIDFCGSNYGAGAWGGADWTGCYASTKVDTCDEFVAKNPAAFADAYFLINSVKWYQKG